MASTSISIYKNIHDTKGRETIHLETFLLGVQSGKWEDQVHAIRLIKDHAARQEAKKKLPYVTISGIFNEGRSNSGLSMHSGVISMDLDGLGNDVEGVRTLLAGDPYVYSVFTSASGTGLCVLFKIDPERHRDAFDGLADYLIKQYQLIVDPSGKDVSRPRYVSYDPNIYISEKPLQFKRYLPKPKKRKIKASIYVQSEFDAVVDQMVSKSVSCVDDYRDWITIGFGLADQFGEAGRGYFHRLSSVSSKYESSMCDRQYTHCLRGNGKDGAKITIATIYWFAREAGIQITSQRTNHIASAASTLKKAGLDASGIAASLAKFEGITGADDIIKQAFAADTDFSEGLSLVENVRMWVRQNHTVKRNLLTRRLENDGQVMEEVDINTMFLDAKILFEKLDFGLFRQILLSRNTPDYNPVHDFIESIEWDGEHRIDRLAMAINSRTGTPEWRSTMFRRWYIGIVSAAYGITNELNFVLVGGKNTGKTEFFRQLLPPELEGYFGTSQLTRGKDDEILMCEKLIILNDEYGGKNKMDKRNEKNLMGSHFFDVRMPYGKSNETIRRLASLCGTCNDLDVLDDPTGNRRIIVMESVGRFDFALYNSIDKYQLMAEALVAFRNGERPKLTDENIIALEAATDGEYSTISFEAEMIYQHFLPPTQTQPWDFMTTTQVKNFLENHTRDKININKLGSQLRKMGYTRTKKEGVYGYDIAPKPVANSLGSI